MIYKRQEEEEEELYIKIYENTQIKSIKYLLNKFTK